MRKPRAILFDDDEAVLELLTLFFEDLEYEVIPHSGPVACPVYQDAVSCRERSPCGDLMITDLVMPGMSGIDMLDMQAQRGCRIHPMNKAIHSGSLGPDSLEAITRLGCRFFHKPASLAELKLWVRECESRMDLSLPLGVPRPARHTPGFQDIVIAIGPGGEEFFAEVVNRSETGSCLRHDHPLSVGQVIDLRSASSPLKDQPAPARVKVQWSKPDSAGSFLSGISEH